MSVLEFVASLAESIAWPVVAVLGVFLFRKPIAALIGRIKQAKAGNFTIDFDSEVDRAKNDATAALDEEVRRRRGSAADSPQQLPDPEPPDVPVSEDPTYAVISSWERLSGAIQDLAGVTAKMFEDPPPQTRNARALASSLHKRGIVNESYVRSLNSLGNLRNAVAHGQKISYVEAERYVAAANELIRATEVITDFGFGAPAPA